MKFSFKLILSLVLLGVFASCMKAGESGLQLKAKDNSKNQIVDVLKGKSKLETLILKYTALKTKCSIKMKKEPRVKQPSEASLVLASTTPTPRPPTAVAPPPVFNTDENMLVYDIFAQSRLDATLTKQVGGTLTITKNALNEDSAEVKISFESIVFSDLINQKVGNATYVMQHSPLLSYNYHYKIKHGDSVVEGSGPNILYERIQNEMVLGAYLDDSYVHKLSMTCKLEGTINKSNPTTKDEFESQWSCVGCAGAGPVNP